MIPQPEGKSGLGALSGVGILLLIAAAIYYRDELPTFLQIKEFFIDQMKNNQFFSTAFVLSIGGTILYQIREIPSLIWTRIHRLIYYEVELNSGNELYEYVSLWIFYNRGSQLRNVVAKLKDDESDVETGSDERPLKGEGANTENRKNNYNIKYYQNGDYFRIRWENRILRISTTKKELPNASNFINFYSFQLFIQGYLAKSAINSFLQNTIDFNESLKVKEINPRIYFWDGYDWLRWNSPQSPSKTFDHIFIPINDKNKLINDLNKWIDRKLWYKEHFIPYKRSYCFYGPPGTGKTTMAVAIGKFLNFDSYILNLSGFKEENGLRSAIQKIKANSILIFEDIDSHYIGRKNVGRGNVSFSSFLNILDGALSREEVITIFTTNKYDTLDEALKRAGRIDFALEVGFPQPREIAAYMENFYKEPVSLYITQNDSIPMSLIQEWCIRNDNSPDAVLKLLYNEKAFKNELLPVNIMNDPIEKYFPKKDNDK